MVDLATKAIEWHRFNLLSESFGAWLRYCNVEEKQQHVEIELNMLRLYIKKWKFAITRIRENTRFLYGAQKYHEIHALSIAINVFMKKKQFAYHNINRMNTKRYQLIRTFQILHKTIANTRRFNAIAHTIVRRKQMKFIG